MTGPILVVEDEQFNIKLFRELLEAKGYDVVEAINGAEGVEMTRTKQPALILMDVQMPVMDGLTATRIIKEDPATRDIPVVALTALAMQGDKERVLAAGCDGYLTKPISLDSFLQMVKDFLPED